MNAPQMAGNPAAGTRRRLLSSLCISLVAVAAIVAFALGFSSVGSATATSEEADEAAQGASYIEQLESRDTLVTENAIEESRRPAAVEKEVPAEEEPDLSAVWSKFDDYAILGDSRAVGFYYYGFLDKSRVIAEGGATINSVLEHETDDQLSALDPRSIYLCYGLNDISIMNWDTVDDYIPALDETIKELKELCPRATVYVNSIMPAHDPAFERSDRWRDIPAWNVAIKAHCEASGIPYVDNSSLSDAHADLWGEDGIHFQTEFYPYWGQNMIDAKNAHEKG